MNYPLINYTNLSSCGTLTTVSVTGSTGHRTKCFKFETMRETDRDFIISKEEWEKFIAWVGATKRDKPCDE